jgi:cation:H+ antiporter
MIILLHLFLMLLVILIAAEVFTNALEHRGERLGISEGVTGSLFAAVGTALPETLIPLLALLAGTRDTQVNEEIGVGAILGAPLMLSTLSLCLMSLAVTGQRGPRGRLSPEPTGLTRDLGFFLTAFLIASTALFIPHMHAWLRGGLACALAGTYVTYALLTLRASGTLVANGHGTEAEEPMLLTRLGLPDGLPAILLQLVLGLVLLLAGAKGFINGVQGGADLLGISALLLSLLIVPVATELPEKVNSILWIRRGKDTMAFGNITGAMVFQGTLLPAIGIMLTPWEPRLDVVAGVLVTLLAALWLRLALALGPLRVWQLWLNGLLYLGYLAVVLG